MKLEIPEALNILLALPAHRSQNENHRRIGTTSLEMLLSYPENSADANEKGYNQAMVALILSAVRIFSVERDRISGVWKSIDAIKNRRERLLGVFENLSPLGKGNYWSKAILLLTSIGFSFDTSIENIAAYGHRFAIYLVGVLVAAEIFSKLSEYLFAYVFERRGPIEKQKVWSEKSVNNYKAIAKSVVETKFRYPQQILP